MEYSISEEREEQSNQGFTLIFNEKKDLSFSCSYSLADQSIESDFTVQSDEMNVSRRQTGNLGILPHCRTSKVNNHKVYQNFQNIFLFLGIF